MALASLPHATRSQVFTALFNTIKTLPPPPNFTSWKTISQFVRSWDDTPAENQPAIYLHRLVQTAKQEHRFGVTKWHWTAMIWIYFRSDGYRTSNTYPDQITDPIIDSVEQLFQTDPINDRFTLGGLVHHCWIDGTIYSDPGLEDGQAVILVPISILL